MTTTSMQAQTPSTTSNTSNSKRQMRRWSNEEHARFLQGLEMFPHGPWSRIAALVGTRTTRQTMAHAQKYRERMEKRANEVQQLWATQGFVQTRNTAAIQECINTQLPPSTTSTLYSRSTEDVREEFNVDEGATELDELDMRILVSLLNPDTDGHGVADQFLHEPSVTAMELESHDIDNSIWSLLTDLADVEDDA